MEKKMKFGKEDLIDKFETKLGEYLMLLTKKELNTMQTRQVSLYLHIISDLERVGDYASNVARVTNNIHEGNISLSEEAQAELNVVMDAVRETAEMTVQSVERYDKEKAMRVKSLAAVVTALCEELKMRHVVRLSHGECDLAQGTAFNDLLNSFDRIVAHCTGAASATVKVEDADSNMHIHTSTPYDAGKEEYRRLLAENAKKYRDLFTEYQAKYNIENSKDRPRNMEL